MLAAIGTLLAGLVSVPALIISLNALKTANQQRADDLEQREEDRRQQAQEKAEAASREKTAFTRNLIIWTASHSRRGFRGWSFRNHNTSPIYLYQDWIPSNGTKSRYYLYVLKPCSQGTIPMPTRGGGRMWLATDDEHSTTGYTLDIPTKTNDAPQPIKLVKWTGGHSYTIAKVNHTRDNIRPCT